jgi:hypothetical protein
LALAAAAYVPLLSCDHDRSTISLVRQIRVAGEQILTAAVWTQTLEDPAEARERYDWLRSNGKLLTEWGRTATILGEEVLSSALDAAWQAELVRREVEHRSVEEEKREAETIWLMQDEVGRAERPAIVMRMGGRSGEPFLTIKLDERWERDRIYDWAQWQSERYREWKEHRDAHGEESLERLIMTEMLRTENAVRKAGLGSGGRRPLRFWRGDEK